MNSTIKTLIFWAVIVLSAASLWQVVRAGPERKISEISYSEFLSRVESGSVAKVTIFKSEIVGESHDGASFRLVPPSSQERMLQLLHDKNVEIWFRETAEGSSPLQLLGSWAPLILLAALWFFMIRKMQRPRSQLEKEG
jgi:cell division protease FtsH